MLHTIGSYYTILKKFLHFGEVFEYMLKIFSYSLVIIIGIVADDLEASYFLLNTH